MTTSGIAAVPLGTQVADVADDGEITFRAEPIAAALGLSPAALMVALREGHVFQVQEAGVGEDLGRTRVTFRHRARQAVFVVDGAGRLLDAR